MRLKRLLWLAFLALVSAALMSTYGKWEYLTFRHQGEFIEPFEESLRQSEFNPSWGELVRVVAYSDKSAQVYTKSGQIAYMVYFQRQGEGRWQMVCSDYCRASNGSNRCFFPWYALGDLFTQIGYYSPGRGCSNRGY